MGKVRRTTQRRAYTGVRSSESIGIRGCSAREDRADRCVARLVRVAAGQGKFQELQPDLRISLKRAGFRREQVAELLLRVRRVYRFERCGDVGIGDAFRPQLEADLDRSPPGEPGLVPGEGGGEAAVVEVALAPERLDDLPRRRLVPLDVLQHFAKDVGGAVLAARAELLPFS